MINLCFFEKLSSIVVLKIKVSSQSLENFMFLLMLKLNASTIVGMLFCFVCYTLYSFRVQVLFLQLKEGEKTFFKDQMIY